MVLAGFSNRNYKRHDTQPLFLKYIYIYICTIALGPPATVPYILAEGARILFVCVIVWLFVRLMIV